MTDMTVGRPTRLILDFAVPLMVASIFQNLYLLVDSVVVGRYLGVVGLATVGVVGPVFYLLNAMFIGLGTAFTIRLAQISGAGGAGRRDVTVALVAVTAIWTVGCMVIVFSFSGVLLSLMGIEGELAADSEGFLHVLAYGFPGLFGSAAVGAYLRGLGDSRGAMWVQIVANVLNAAFVWWFVGGLGTDVDGAAWATGAATTVALLGGIVVAVRKHPAAAAPPSSRPVVIRELRGAMRLGAPLASQHIVLAVGIMVLVAVIETYGETAVAAFTVIARIEGLAAIPFLSVSGALTAFVAQNLGNRDGSRIRDGIVSSVWIAVASAVPVTLVLVVLRDSVAALFTDDPEARRLTATYILVIFPFLLLYAVMVVLHGYLNGAGRTTAPFVCTIIAFVVVQVPFAALMGELFGIRAVMWAVVAGWLVGTVYTVLVVARARAKDSQPVVLQSSEV